MVAIPHRNLNVKWRTLLQPKWIVVMLLLSLSAVTRLYNIEQTATFFWDPAYDLMKIHEYYQNKEITLIGPISEDGNKVYGSLTYYLLMPFAVLGDFDIASTTYGAAVWGLLTVLLVLALVYILNKQLLLPIAFLCAIWFPLLETSRWAWNPHLVLFWIALGLILMRYQKPPTFLIAGICLGLTIHHHYLAAISTGIFVGLQSFFAIRDKKLKLHLWLIGGYTLAILPFVLFDLTHPPGLFLTRVLYFNQTDSQGLSGSVVSKIWLHFSSVLTYYTQSKILAFLLGLSVAGLAIFDWKKHKRHMIYLSSWIAQLLAVVLIKDSFQHYFLPGLLFFLIYILLPREKIGKWLSWCAISVLIVGSILTVWPQLSTQYFSRAEWQPNIATTRKITDLVEQQYKELQLTKTNIAVLGSSDPNTYGWKYRSLLSIRGIAFLSKHEYFSNDYLFIVSQTSLQDLQKAPAAEMHNFSDGKLKGTWEISDSNWKVYLLSH